MDNNFFIDWMENDHLQICKLKNKKEYYEDLQVIDDSITGRADAFIANHFIYEAKYLIINAIRLYELGYFDCAYYSLREAIEMSTTMVYLVDIPENEKKEKLNAWKNLERFPMRNKMLEYLKNNGTVFVDFKEKMTSFFDDSIENIEGLNKYVHKQGIDRLYTLKKWHDCENKINVDYYIEKFEKYIHFTIAYVAIMRLSIDPLPLLLNEEEIYLKIGSFITNPYSQEFIDKYIDKKYIDDYKMTELYKGHFSYFDSLEKQSIVISNIIKDNYVDISKYDEIIKQFHLLNEYQQIIVKFFKISDKISNIYLNAVPISYFSNTESKRKKHSYSTKMFDDFKNSKTSINQKFDEVYMSFFSDLNYDYYVEHNEILTNYEIERIEEIFKH